MSRWFHAGLMHRASLGLAAFALCLGLRTADPAPVSAAGREITALLEAQSAAWNRGDIDGFMLGYAQTDSLRFASGDSVTYGWKPTLEAYKRRYPDQATMGKLEFSGLDITELAPDAAIVFGRWRLTREKDAPHGLFTLTLKKSAAGWRIIFDHTSGGD